MFVLIAGIFGLLLGSAINAIVWRLYVGRSWVHGRSVCPECEHTLAPKDLIPVLSWLLLRGKCRYCRAPIKDSPIVELVTAGVFALSAYSAVPSTLGWISLTFWAVMLVLLVILATYDARWLILPDKIMIPLIVVALLSDVSLAVLTRQPALLTSALLAAVIGGGFFYAIVFFSKGKAMGGGDIKLVFAMGLILGLKGLAVALLVAFNTAAVVGVAVILAHKRRFKDQIPFGPYLVGGTVLAFLYAKPLIDWYLHSTGLN